MRNRLCLSSIVGLFATLIEFDRIRKDRSPTGSGRAWYYYIEQFPLMPLLGLLNTCTRLAAYDNNPASPVAQYFKNATLFEASLEVIQAETQWMIERPDRLRAFSEVDPLYSNIDPKRSWKVYVLKWYDNIKPGARHQFPRLTKLLDGMPEVKSAMLSLLPPHSSIPTHSGISTLTLRYHLGIAIPGREGFDAPHIFVDGSRHFWREGHSMLFDDTYEHNVTNPSSGWRLVLFCDVLKDVRWPMRPINQFITDHVVRWTGAFADY